MQNKGFNLELSRGLPKPVYFLWSEESFFLEEALNQAMTSVFGLKYQERSESTHTGIASVFSCDVFHPDTTPADIINAAKTLPFMSKRRFVAVKDFHKFSSSNIKALASYFKEPCESTCMVILSEKEPKAFDFKWVVYHLKIREAEIPQWVKNRASERGIRMTDGAISYLLELVGPDIGLLVMEIEKLSLSGLKDIDVHDVEALTADVRGFTSFNLVDAIICSDRDRAFRILKRLLEDRSSEPSAILGAISWHYRQFYNLWEGKGRRPAKMRDATYKVLSGLFPSYREEDFCRIFKDLHEADVGIKTSGRPSIVLETLLIKLLQRGRN